MAFSMLSDCSFFNSSSRIPGTTALFIFLSISSSGCSLFFFFRTLYASWVSIRIIHDLNSFSFFSSRMCTWHCTKVSCTISSLSGMLLHMRNAVRNAWVLYFSYSSSKPLFSPRFHCLTEFDIGIHCYHLRSLFLVHLYIRVFFNGGGSFFIIIHSDYEIISIITEKKNTIVIHPPRMDNNRVYICDFPVIVYVGEAVRRQPHLNIII